MIKKITTFFLALSCLFLFAVPAFAHVIVRPNQVGIAVTQDFLVNVPNEKDNPIVSVRLLIPDVLSSVVPYVAQGWTITTKTSGSGDNTTVSEIDWSGGSIPVGQAEELGFQAQVPAKPTTLNWKAYQTYSDGTVVSWDVNPDTMKNLSDEQQDQLADKENKGEYSTTQVINDLTKPAMQKEDESHADKVAVLLAAAAFVMSGIAVVFAIKKN